MDLVKQWLLVVGLILAVLGAFVEIPYMAQIMIIAGLVMGWFCVSDSNATGFLIAAMALVGMGMGVNALEFIGTHIGSILAGFGTFLGAAAFLVAFRALFNTARG